MLYRWKCSYSNNCILVPVKESLVLRNFILNSACLINECYVTYVISNFAI